MPADCLFCRIVAGEIPSDRLHDDDLVIAIRDIAPRAPTHLLLMPRRHIASAAELTEADGPLLGPAVRRRGRARAVRRDRRRRLPARLQRRAVGRPDGRSPARPPDGRARVRLAARVRRAGVVARPRDRRLVALALLVAGCAASESAVADRLPVATVQPGDDRHAGRQPDPRGARARARDARTSCWPTARRPSGPPRRRSLARRRGPCTRSLLPKDPTKGFIVVYEFPDARRAAQRGRRAAGLPRHRPGSGPAAAGDRHGHPPGRLDGRRLRLAAGRLATIRRPPGSRPRSRRSAPASRSRTRVSARRSAACPRRPRRGPGCA